MANFKYNEVQPGAHWEVDAGVVESIIADTIVEDDKKYEQEKQWQKQGVLISADMVNALSKTIETYNKSIENLYDIYHNDTDTKLLIKEFMPSALTNPATGAFLVPSELKIDRGAVLSRVREVSHDISHYRYERENNTNV